MIAELEELLPSANGLIQKVSLLRRKDRLQLAMPLSRRAARAALQLYPAQRTAARLLRGALRTLALLGLPLPLTRGTICLPEENTFVQFLRSLAEGKPFDLAVMPGNPNAAGRRWLCLVFDGGSPSAVAKAGTTPAARALIRRERDFLTQHRPAHAPLPTRELESENISAFALPFVPEHRDQSLALDAALEITRKWLIDDARTPLTDRPAFRALTDHAQSPGERNALAKLGAAPAVRTLTHGDFAPWNLKRDQTTEKWCVLDWERGDPDGVPGWDILHFVIQPLVLVHRTRPAAIAGKLDKFLGSALWEAWASHTGLGSFGSELVCSYLLHAARVQKQSEGAATIEALLSIFSSRCAA